MVFFFGLNFFLESPLKKTTRLHILKEYTSYLEKKGGINNIFKVRLTFIEIVGILLKQYLNNIFTALIFRKIAYKITCISYIDYNSDR